MDSAFDSMVSDDEAEETIEKSGEASSVVASWLGLDSGDDSDDGDEDDDIDAEKFVRAPRLGLGAKFIPHKPVEEVQLTCTRSQGD